ncbi:MAG: hypothetical protein A2499_08475 [Stygiobacter sp. RIFOXYC12_FULL_38_8]|nr:MAG: hypothetical protein A2X62_02780 [Stygiobacter sp. GWC2_38_9]OGU79916.1 MAG: hypothetical protein A2279_07520 [Stygiobacter sp. RIFOXYA12_FULL_38_9]OGV06485.1 MAG: hypothetical protein A2299_02150 [Stygiobacter sp. RIFOXYB2_FULL_37_11]OGV10521.1 MAG: hypothetical protein A2237_18750 [Stygiobacter sp. RIFOXYA2_FULL_38_8]OGV13254.1 MAG: hypothetical protein A2440_13070 [Stygiobacter sp. RIFOXYC2_FULL_38_25]OGV25750.1 MAG: hypothetical protein A2499_08475 [Stygiobacter sp. RIFOXYC12_FULL_
MKRTAILILLLFAIVILVSCEENVSPKGELPEKYAINFILRGDTTFQIAYLSKLYDVEGYDPSTLKTDPAVSGAIIYLKYSDSNEKYYLRDTLDNSNINTAYNTPAKYYYIKNFKPQFGKQIQLQAELPNTNKLSSSSTTPTGLVFDNTKSLSYIPGPLLGRDTTYASIYWNGVGLDVVKAKRVKIIYYYRELSGEKTRHEKLVPIKYSTDGITESIVYNDLSFQNELKIQRQLLTKALKEISDGYTSKGRFSLAYLEVEVLSFDENLTKYYSTNLFYDFGFTVRNYPSDLTNINGGLGFFGSYVSAKKILKFDSQYALNEFGYLTEK